MSKSKPRKTNKKKKEVKEMEEGVMMTPIERLTMELEKIEKNQFKIMFWVLDTKGNPSSSLSNIYEMALSLTELGYEVNMLYQANKDDVFVGVEEWMGSKYSSLPHFNIELEKEKVLINVSDILIIPEVFANVAEQTKILPCKRVMLVQNYNHIFEFLSVGKQWGDYGIIDAITTTNKQKELIQNVFPYARTKVIEPVIPSVFRPTVGEKELTISIISKDQSNLNQIIKPFYLQYPIYKFVSFIDLRSLPIETFAEGIRNSAITVWVNDVTMFGANILKAIQCGNIVVAKVPEIIPEWAYEEDGKTLTNAVIWVDEMNQIPSVIAGCVNAFMNDTIPTALATSIDKIKNKFTKDKQKEQLKVVFSNYIKDRRDEIVRTIKAFEKELKTKK